MLSSTNNSRGKATLNSGPESRQNSRTKCWRHCTASMPAAAGRCPPCTCANTTHWTTRMHYRKTRSCIDLQTSILTFTL